MSDSTPPPTPELARQRLILRVVIVAFLAMGVLVLTVVPHLALPVRIFVAAMDFILAAVIWLVLRQKFSGR